MVFGWEVVSVGKGGELLKENWQGWKNLCAS